MSKIKIVYIISHTDKALAFEWMADRIDKNKFQVYFILLNPSGSDLEDYLRSKNIFVYRIPYTSKRKLLSAFCKITLFLLRIKPNIVHCHLFDASLVGLIASKLAFVKKRIYTRHHSLYHHNYFPNAVKYDKLINWLSTDIIAISNLVKNVLINQEDVPASKIHIVYHGLEIKSFTDVSVDRIDEMRLKYNIHKNRYPVVGVISRYIELKGVQYVIPAFKQILKEYPNALLILANASGNFKAQIKKQLSELPGDTYLEIEFEKDLFCLYKLFNVFIHVPIAINLEAFGQTYIEALASQIPSVFTLSGIAPEFIEDRKNAVVVPYKDKNAIYSAVKEILENVEFKKTIVKQGFEDVKKNFSIEKTMSDLEKVYLS